MTEACPGCGYSQFWDGAQCGSCKYSRPVGRPIGGDPTRLACPGCEKVVRVPAGAAGKRVRCKACDLVFHIPTSAGQPPAPAEPAPTSQAPRAGGRGPKEPPVPTDQGLPFILGHRGGNGAPMQFRVLVTFDPASGRAVLHRFEELVVNDALKSCPVPHDLTMLWDTKGEAVGAQRGGLVGSLAGNMAQSALTGDSPEVVVGKIRDMPLAQSGPIMGHITKGLDVLQTVAFHDLRCIALPSLCFRLYYGDDQYVGFHPGNENVIPPSVPRVAEGDDYYLRVQEQMRRDDRMFLLTLVGAGVIVLVVTVVCLIIALRN